jgi:hypothetical protein
VLSAREVAPGAAATLTVTFTTLTFVGEVAKTVTITTDDPDRPTVSWKVRVEVAKGVLQSPQNFFFNPVLVGAVPSASVRVQWHEAAGKPFQVLGVEAVEVKPADLPVRFETKPFDAPPWHGHEITLTFASPPPVGFLTGTVLIRTDAPEAPEVKALFSGSVSGRVRVSLARPSFGIVPQGKGAKLLLLVMPFDETVDLGEVTVASRKGAVVARAARDARQPTSWRVELRLPETAPPGPVEDVVEIRTAVKGEEVVELPVSGSVREAPK